MNRSCQLIAAAAVAAIAALAACSTVMPTAQSGFLSDYTALTRASDEASASRASADQIDPARVSVDAVTWQVHGTLGACRAFPAVGGCVPAHKSGCETAF